MENAAGSRSSLSNLFPTSSSGFPDGRVVSTQHNSKTTLAHTNVRQLHASQQSAAAHNLVPQTQTQYIQSHSAPSAAVTTPAYAHVPTPPHTSQSLSASHRPHNGKVTQLSHDGDLDALQDDQIEALLRSETAEALEEEEMDDYDDTASNSINTVICKDVPSKESSPSTTGSSGHTTGNPSDSPSNHHHLSHLHHSHQARMESFDSQGATNSSTSSIGGGSLGPSNGTGDHHHASAPKPLSKSGVTSQSQSSLETSV